MWQDFNQTLGFGQRHFKNLSLKVKVISGLVFLVLVIVMAAWMNSNNSKRSAANVATTQAAAPNALNDTLSESERRYTAQINRVEIENQMLEQRNAAQASAFERDLTQIKSDVARQINEAVSNEREALDARYQLQGSAPNAPSTLETTMPPLPPLEETDYAIGSQNTAGRVPDRQRLTTTPTSLTPLSLPSPRDALLALNDADGVTPVYTIPVGSTLVNAVNMTALIGRVPIRGDVFEPYPFKLLLGGENLAANGIRIPNLDGIVVTGSASGDLQLSCVRARVKAMTFVFNDGTISTTEDDDGLGYISTATGVPCIQGDVISSAPKYLASQIGLGAARGAASAFAENQVVTNFNGFNNETFVAGDAFRFVGGNAAADGLAEAQDWLARRQEDSHDVIFTRANQKLVVNIDQQIEIDFDKNGRKVSYAFDNSRSAQTGYLD